jgi:signal transduction histidine kinase
VALVVSERLELLHAYDARASDRPVTNLPANAHANAEWAELLTFCTPHLQRVLETGTARTGLAIGHDWDGQSAGTPEGPRWIVSIVPVGDDPSERRAGVIVLDATERLAAQERLRQAQRLESVGRLAGGLVHDFNNLLAAIKLNCALALTGPALEGEARADLEAIAQTVDRATMLARRLLASTRPRPVEPRALELNDIVAEVTQMLRRALTADEIELELALDPALARVRADAGQLEQVLVNLVVNACDAMPNGGTITIRTANVTVTAAHEKRGRELAPGSYVMLTVGDTGCGMDPATQARIFEPFFTTKPATQGTGLGLAVVRGIIKQWGGCVYVESARGIGSTFEIYLPQCETAR